MSLSVGCTPSRYCRAAADATNFSSCLSSRVEPGEERQSVEGGAAPSSGDPSVQHFVKNNKHTHLCRRLNGMAGGRVHGGIRRGNGLTESPHDCFGKV